MLDPEAPEFDYANLDTETRNVVQQCSDEIKERKQVSAQATWEIGQKLFKVRDLLGYGKFDSWLKVEFEWSRRTGYNYISVFEAFRSCATLSQVKITISALYVLARPSTPEKARLEALERTKNGETIDPSKANAIISKYKEYHQRQSFSTLPSPSLFATEPRREHLSLANISVKCSGKL